MCVPHPAPLSAAPCCAAHRPTSWPGESLPGHPHCGRTHWQPNSMVGSRHSPYTSPNHSGGLLDVTPLCLISSYIPHLPLLSRTTHTSSTQPNYLQQGPPQGTRKSIHSDLSSTAQTDVACYSLDHLPSPLSTLHHQVASPLHDPERKQHWLRSASKLHTHIIVSPWLHCIQLCHLPCLYRPGVHFSTNDERASPPHPPPAMPSGGQHQADP